MTQIAEKPDTQALVVAEFNEFETKLAEFKEKYIDVVYDLEDADQEKQARSDRLAIGKVVSALDTKHKELKAPLKAQTDLIDGERKRIKDDLLDVQGKIKSQIAEHERKIQEHAEMLQDKVDAIRALADFDGYVRPDSNQIAARLIEAQAIEVDDSYEHRKADATLAQVDVIKDLEAMHAAQVQHEEEQAELDRLRKEAADREQADREERIRAEAVEQAKAEAEKKAQEEKKEKEAQRVRYYESMIKHINQCAHGFIGGKLQSSYGILLYELEEKIVIDDSWGEFEAPAIEAKNKAISTLKSLQETSRLKADEKEKQAAEQAKETERAAYERAAQAERERIEKEQRQAEAKAEQARQAEEARKSKQKHRAKIHGEAKKAFMDNGFDATEANVIVSLIKDEKITNIKVIY